MTSKDATAVVDNGANPMRWCCEKQGCFNLKKRVKLEEFAECLPGRMAFGDIDGITEIGGNFLIQEWKARGAGLPTGQRIMFERLTASSPFIVLVVEGDAETMVVKHITKIWHGKVGKRDVATLDTLKATIKAWAAWAGVQP